MRALRLLDGEGELDVDLLRFVERIVLRGGWVGVCDVHGDLSGGLGDDVAEPGIRAYGGGKL